MPFISLLLTLILQSPAHPRQLSTATRFRCDFLEGTQRIYDDRGQPSSATRAEPVKDLVFDSIDHAAGRALSHAGDSSFTVRVQVATGDRTLSFSMASMNGSPAVLTIFTSPRPREQPDHERYFAVLSRHADQPDGRFVASQLYGACRAD